MANGNFIVQNGLQVGPLTINAATGDISTSGNLTVSGSGQINVTNIGVSSIAKNDTSISITDTGTGSNVRIIVDGQTEHTVDSDGVNLAAGDRYAINGISVLSETTLGNGVTSSNLTSVGTIVTGTWSGSFGAVSGANLTNLTAANLVGTAATANVSLYDSVTATTTNASFYPQVADKTSGNVSAYTVSSFSINPSTGALSATSFNGALNGPQNGTVGATTPSTGAFTTLTAQTETVGGLQAAAIGNVTPGTGAFTTVSASGVITSTVATGTAPLTVSSTTKVTNLNADLVDGYSADTANTINTIAVRDASGIITASGFNGAHNGTVGATTPNTGAFTTVSASGITQITNTTGSTSTTTGALVVSGGLGVAGNVTIGGNLYVANLISTSQSTLVVQDSLVYFQSPTPGQGSFNYDIGFYSDYTVLCSLGCCSGFQF